MAAVAGGAAAAALFVFVPPFIGGDDTSRIVGRAFGAGAGGALGGHAAGAFGARFAGPLLPQKNKIYIYPVYMCVCF